MRLERRRVGMSDGQQVIVHQRMCEQIEAQLADIAANITAIQTAQSTATAAARESARINSYPNPGSVLSAVDAGSTATATLAAHTRVYPVQGTIDVPDVTFTNLPVDFTGLPFSTRHWVYYDDTTLTNTAPTFQITTSAVTAQVGTAAGRHFVGYIDTPADGGTGTSGVGGGTPGGGGGAPNGGGYLN
jgi:hypothetical protein